MKITWYVSKNRYFRYLLKMKSMVSFEIYQRDIGMSFFSQYIEIR